jgi:hypothetical protein
MSEKVKWLLRWRYDDGSVCGVVPYVFSEREMKVVQLVIDEVFRVGTSKSAFWVKAMEGEDE